MESVQPKMSRKRRYIRMLHVVTLLWILPELLVLGMNMEVPSFSLSEITSRIEKGRAEIAKLHQRSMLPKGTCWKSALEELQISCKEMSPEVQSRLALRFTTCFNELLGFPQIICEKFTPLPACMKVLDDNSKSTFREFFLHTQDMCYFLEHQLWQEKTSDAVNEVTHAVVGVTKNLEEAKETQVNILQSQQESLKVQSTIIKDNSLLHSLVLNIKDVFQDVQTSAMEQRQVFLEIFEKLSRMQTLVSWIQGEMSLLDMMGFYFACIIFGFFGTASERTRKARFWIVLLMIGSVGCERFLYSYLNSLALSPESIQEYVWILRRIAAIVGVLIIIISAAYYRDPQMAQNDMLRIVNKRLDLVLAYMEDMKRGNNIDSEKPRPALTASAEDDEQDDFSDADTYSNYSNDSERTGIIERQTVNIRETIDSDFNDENMVPETDPRVTNNLFRHVAEHATAAPLREMSPGHSTMNETRHSYNLRARKASVSRDSSFQQESMSDFVNTMKRPKRQPMTSAANRRSQYYSSDEEM